MNIFSIKYSIRGRLLLLAIGVELLMLSLLVANSMRLLHGAMTDQAKWHLQELVPVLSAALKAPLVQRDFATVLAILQESRISQGIDYLVVTDREGRQVASSGLEQGARLPLTRSGIDTFSLKQARRHDAVFNIEQSGQSLGTIHIGIDLTHIVSARNRILSQGIAIAAVELTLSSIILLIIGLWLTRHLSALTSASLKVASGDLSPPPLREGEDDIGRLGAAFNTMSRALAERVAELVKAKESAEAIGKEKARSEEQLKLVLDGTRDAFWDWDIPADHIAFNNRWAEMLGFDRDELEPYTESWEKLVHPDDRQMAITALNNHLDGLTQFYEAEYRIRSKSGAWLWILDRGKVVARDSEGRPVRVAGTHTDINDRKSVEEQLSEKRAQLESLNRSLQERVTEAVSGLRQRDQMLISQSRQAAMGEMIGNIAHQWRQPLNALSMLITNIHLTYQDGDLTDIQLAESVKTADRLIQKMSSTITDFRNFFSPDKEMITFSALEQISHAVALVDTAFRSINIEIVVESTIDLTLNGFPNEYSQVLLNLLTNAKDAIVENRCYPGYITISINSDSGMGRVSVKDNGGGIADDVLDKVFEPYFSTKNMGTGIGLYMSKMIIERNMNGTISVHNIEGGCQFDVAVPIFRGLS